MALTRSDALSLARNYGIPLDGHFHALGTEIVEHILEAANSIRYRAPKNANGSRARYFHAYLVRLANRKTKD